MDDLSTTLQQILNDPRSMSQLRAMADSLLPPGGEAPPPAAPSSPPDLTALSGLMGALRGGQEDDRTRLLRALKPHLSEGRAARVDQAVRLLRLVSLLPLLRQSHLLDDLLGEEASAHG